jgi:lysostaphin
MKVDRKVLAAIFVVLSTLQTLTIQQLVVADLPPEPFPLDKNINLTTPIKFIMPSSGAVVSGQYKKSINIYSSIGTPVYSAADGVVEKAGWNRGGYGNLIKIRHSNGSFTLYGHISKILVQVGQKVEQGEKIALMGNTGFSRKPNLYFAIEIPGKGKIDPMEFLR